MTDDMHDPGLQLRRLTDELLNNMSLQERDRLRQTQMARARGPELNALLLRQMTDVLLNMRRHGAGYFEGQFLACSKDSVQFPDSFVRRYVK